MLIADENTHRGVINRLRDAGLTPEWIKESMPGTPDSDILARADIGSAIFITNDRDFGDLIFHRGMPAPGAILYVRLPHRLADATADRLLALLEVGVTTGHMITITKDGERKKPFPPGASDA